MKYLLVDGDGNVRGIYAVRQTGLREIEGESSRELEEVPDDDPRVRAILNPPKR